MNSVEFSDISKSYVVDHDGEQQRIFACRNVSFNIQKNTIHALIGENGAGKSTLMKMLAGVESIDSGQIIVNEKKYQPQSAADAHRFKIGIVHQHFLLAENLSVLDHLILNWPVKGLFKKITKTKIQDGIKDIEKKFNWQFKLDEKIKNLSVGEQQRLEILKALLVNPEILIFDEPTAVLAPQEIEDFLKFIFDLKKLGQTIILITHKLHEVKMVADHFTVLRHGQVVQSGDIVNVSVDQMAEMMIGRSLEIKNSANATSAGEKNKFQFSNGQLNLNSSEIFGVAGIDGNGQSELIEKIILDFKKQKINYADISEDRLKLSIFPGLTLLEHMLLTHSSKLSKWGFVLKNKAQKITKKLLVDWDIRPPEFNMKIENLSGGNQQKFVVAKEMLKDPHFIIAAYPTRGVDLLAQQTIYKALQNAATQHKKTVLLVSSDLDEILKLSDRYVIICKNKLYGPFFKNELTESQIGRYMAGSV
jgi:general nucleoside transport system ATP-binding protein